MTRGWWLVFVVVVIMVVVSQLCVSLAYGNVKMAWRCSSTTNDGLVENLRRSGIIQSNRVFDAMKRTDRAKYVVSSGFIGTDNAYLDSPQPIGHMQTISAPHMHAYALEYAEIAIKNVQSPRILDVGAGSGYLSACLGRMVEDMNGRVFGIEKIPELVELARKNVLKADQDLVNKGILTLERGDGWNGLPNEAPFHFIHVGAAAEAVPVALMEQLAEGGRLVVPVGPSGGDQVLTEVIRTPGGQFKQKKLMGVSYVPLVRERTEL